MHKQGGFSLIKLMFVLTVLGSVVWSGYNVFPVYYHYWLVEGAFKAISRNMSDNSAARIRRDLPGIFHVKYIEPGDVPQQFYDNLKIEANGTSVDISSHYHVTVWLLGPVQGVDPKSDYNKNDLRGMDRVRDKFRLDFDFNPHARTP